MARLVFLCAATLLVVVSAQDTAICKWGGWSPCVNGVRTRARMPVPLVDIRGCGVLTETERCGSSNSAASAPAHVAGALVKENSGAVLSAAAAAATSNTTAAAADNSSSSSSSSSSSASASSNSTATTTTTATPTANATSNATTAAAASANTTATSSAGAASNVCQLSEWSAWTVCQDGIQYRLRNVTVAPKAESGEVCPPLLDTKSCDAGASSSSAPGSTSSSSSSSDPTPLLSTSDDPVALFGDGNANGTNGTSGGAYDGPPRMVKPIYYGQIRFVPDKSRKRCRGSCQKPAPPQPEQPDERTVKRQLDEKRAKRLEAKSRAAMDALRHLNRPVVVKETVPNKPRYPAVPAWVRQKILEEMYMPPDTD